MKRFTLFDQNTNFSVNGFSRLIKILILAVGKKSRIHAKWRIARQKA